MGKLPAYRRQQSGCGCAGEGPAPGSARDAPGSAAAAGSLRPPPGRHGGGGSGRSRSLPRGAVHHGGGREAGAGLGRRRHRLRRLPPVLPGPGRPRPPRPPPRGRRRHRPRSQAEGTPLRARDLLNVTHRCLHPGVPPLALDAEFWALRDSLMQCELWVLRVLRFRLPLAQAHKYLAQFALALGQWARGGRGGAGRGLGAAAGRGRGGAGAAEPPPARGGRRAAPAMELCGCGAPPGAPPHWWQ
ncbi:uncharacterized protein LOC133263457, partial [Pezoporus flaviventris]|uniref:uncharacterized protein LOC133263457 n=1 Tax=Pezoporus flaviventris TaxID=889875 RepID=UPI002AB073DC